MKLHHLRLRGIGPFRDEAVLDLAAPGASGTFLLEGPTGSGKSTVLDAIVFALYGGVAGEGSGTDRIRSQFADPFEPSYVDLVFETGAGIFRVRRSPQYERPKKRGDGTTTQHAKALLWRLDSPALIPAAIADALGEGAGVEVRATRLDEVGAQIQAAIGLTREQFTQTVLLPQGEFQRFLTARTAERQQVLTRVFGTQLYEEIERELEMRRKQARAHEADASSVLGRAVERFTEASGHAVAPAPQPEEEPERAPDHEPDLMLQLEDDAQAEAEADREPVPLTAHVEARRLDLLAEDADRITTAVDAAAVERREQAEAQAERLATARDLLQSRESVLTLLQRRASLDELAARLDAAAEQNRDDTRRLLLHEVAGPVRDALQRRDAAAARATQAAQALTAARQELARDNHDLGTLLDGDSPAAALTELASTQLDLAGRLSSLVDLEKELPERADAITQRRATRQESITCADALATQSAQRPAARAQLQAQLEDAKTAASALTDAKLAERSAADAVTAAQEAASRATAVTRAEDAAQKASTAAQSAIDHEHALRTRRRAGLAAELASALEEGEPCAVCGSTTHPAPAAPGADHVDADELEAAEQARSSAETAHARTAAALATARERLAEAQEKAGGIDVAAARAQLENAQAAVAAATRAQADAERVETTLAEHDRTSQTLREQEQTARARIDAATTWITDAEQRLAEDRETLAAARGDAPSVSARMQAHRDRASAAQHLRDLHSAADQATTTHHELRQDAERIRSEASAHLRAAGAETVDTDSDARAAVSEVSTRTGGAARTREPGPDSVTTISTALATDDAVRAAVLETAERTRLQQRVNQHRVDRARLADGLAEPGIADLTATPEALEAARTAVTDAREDVTRSEQTVAQAQAAAGTATDRAERTRGARVHLTEAITRLRSVAEQAGAIIRVADLATGNAGDRVRLSTYVLMRRFDDVVDAANARLARMGDAHLELVRDDDLSGRGKTGLDLLVIDRRTDQTRRPDTLSGGETFIVSLALALGLADTVSAEAGGITMQTLFIDEGFGSLDPERLDGVIEEIARIAEGGRSVGIVSHVAELKTRIPDRISVRRRADATSTLTVTA